MHPWMQVGPPRIVFSYSPPQEILDVKTLYNTRFRDHRAHCSAITGNDLKAVTQLYSG